MAKSTKKKTTKPVMTKGKKGGNRMMMAGVAGAVVGAAIGGATAVALSDKKTRDKVGKTLTDVTNYAADTMAEMDSEVYEVSGPTAPGMSPTEPTVRKRTKTGS